MPSDISSTVCVRTDHQWSACRACLDSCPAKAITLSAQGVNVSADGCTDCGQCIVACPVGAITGSPPQRRRNATQLWSDASAGPTPKELLLFRADGVTEVAIFPDHALWRAALDSANNLLRQMELRPLEAVTPPPPSLETVSIARRSFLRMSRDGDGGVREGVKILSLVAAYPTHQFFDIAIDIHTCDRCGACAAQCPEQCISFSEDGIEIESGRCTGCQLCRDGCTSRSIVVTAEVGARQVKSLAFVRKQCDVCKRDYDAFKNSKADEILSRCPACRFRETVGIPRPTIGQCGAVS